MSDPVLLGPARRLLAEAQTPEDFASVMRLAEAARTFAQQANLGPVKVDEASRLAAMAVHGLAATVDEGQLQGLYVHGKRPGQRPNETTLGSLKDLKAEAGFNDKQLQQGRLLAQAYPNRDDLLTLEGPQDGLFDGRAQIVATARRIVQGTDEAPDDWYTPAWLLDAIGIRYDLDVCAPRNPAARSVPADVYYTEDDDGLTQPWYGRVWCNPPYSNSQPWAERMAEHGNGIWLSLARNGKWIVPLLDRASVVRLWVQAKFTLINGHENSVPNAELLVAFGDECGAALADASLGDKITAPMRVIK